MKTYKEKLQRMAIRWALGILLKNPTSKSEAKYFAKWKQATSDLRYIFTKNLRQMFIKIYKNKLVKAFNRWQVKMMEKLVNHEVSKVDDWQDKNLVLGNRLRNLDRENEVSANAERYLVSKRLRRLCLNAFRSRMIYYFCKWREGAHHRVG